ncbi:MAG: DUF1579 family protein [Gemmatimonadota bacterium]
MEVPKPAAAHKLLHALPGDWIGDETVHPSPWAPQGAKSVGRVKNKVALGGLAVIQHYDQEMGGTVVFKGHGIFTVDRKQNQHVMYWFDTMLQSPPNFSQGGFSGTTLVLVSESGEGQTRASWQLAAPDEYEYKLEVSEDGQQWTPRLDAIYRRAK